MENNKIAFFYKKFDQPVYEDDTEGLIQLHIQSFMKYGWDVVLVNEDVAKLHPLYNRLIVDDTVLKTSKNHKEYTQACYERWLAYAYVGLPFADFDVINYGFTPEDAKKIINKSPNPSDPIFLSAATAIGLVNKEGYDSILSTYLDFIKNPKIEGALKEDVNDMTIMRELHPEWYNLIPYSDQNFCKDFSLPGYESSKLVHYTFAYSKRPRLNIVLNERPF